MNQDSDDLRYMNMALDMARRAEEEGEVPVGAVLVKDGSVIATGWNQPISSCDPSAHAEIQVLRQAGLFLRNYRLNGTTLYVTLEPCIMCLGAMIHARISRLVYGATDPKSGALGGSLQLQQGNHFNHQLQVTAGIAAEQCGQILKTFFQQRRK